MRHNPRVADGNDPAIEARFDKYVPYWDLMKEGPADDALRRLIELAEEAPDEDHLATLAVVLMEPLVDVHWEAILPALRDALRRSPNLRRVYAGSILHIPDEIDAELRGLG